MNWRAYLTEGWRNLSGGLRRVVYGLLVASLGMILLAFVLPPEQQLWAVLGLFGLFVAVQGVILWRMAQQRPALRLARRAFIRADFDTVLRVLEEDRAKGQADVISLTLLGNAYRQLGRLSDSEARLRAALEEDPESPLASYGLGRTLLAQGQFASAAALIEQAITHGAQPVVAVELALSLTYAGQPMAAGAALGQAAAFDLEPQRELMAAFLRWQGGGLETEAARSRMRQAQAGLEVWQAEAARFSATPYGAALAADVARMEQVLIPEAPA